MFDYECGDNDPPFKQTEPTTNFVDGPENSKKRSLIRTYKVYYTVITVIVNQPRLKNNLSSCIALKLVKLMVALKMKNRDKTSPNKAYTNRWDFPYTA
jgi:hypothetical protein